MNSIGRFFLVCLGAGLFMGGLGLTLTGVGAIVGFPLMAVGMAMAEVNASRPRR